MSKEELIMMMVLLGFEQATESKRSWYNDALAMRITFSMYPKNLLFFRSVAGGLSAERLSNDEAALRISEASNEVHS